MGEPRVLTREEVEALAVDNLWPVSAKACVRATCLDLFARLERARLELACERGERGPWSGIVSLHAVHQRWIVGPGGMVHAVIEHDTWWSYDVHGDPTRWAADGSCSCFLDGIEQALTALGREGEITWARAVE